MMSYRQRTHVNAGHYNLLCRAMRTGSYFECKVAKMSIFATMVVKALLGTGNQAAIVYLLLT